MTDTHTPSRVSVPTSTRDSARRRSSIALSLAAVGGLAVAACGGGSSDDDSGIASIDDATDEADGDIDPELAMADYRECLAANGANIDVQVGAGGGSISLDGGGGEADPQSGGLGGLDMEAFQAAVEACSELGQAAMGAFTPDPQQEAAMQDAQLRFEACMADKGLDGYAGSMMTSQGGLSLDDDGPSADPQSSGSLDDVDPDVLAAALDECSAAFDELEAS
ncbi:MAG: hypothetical protein AAFY28_10805 [Actinomycetota bacterium]